MRKEKDKIMRLFFLSSVWGNLCAPVSSSFSSKEDFFSRAGGKETAGNCPSFDPTHVQGDAVLKLLRDFASLMM